MAPVEIDKDVKYSYVPLAVVTAHAALAIYFSANITKDLVRSYKALAPSQDTRSRTTRRHTIISTFAALAAASLSAALYYALAYTTLSYRLWAAYHSFEVPSRLIGQNGIIGRNSVSVHPIYWLTDTYFYVDYFEIMVERARRFWWGQQLHIGTVVWSTFVAIQGRKHNIPNLLSYIGLAQLVSLSFGQFLFYIAISLAPLPLAQRQPNRLDSLIDRVFLPKPQHWQPSARVYSASAISGFVSVMALYYTYNMDSGFETSIFLSKLATLLPLLLPRVIPAKWGSVQQGDESQNLVYVFRLMSAIGFLLHGKTTIAGLVYNAPETYYTKHSVLIPFDRERLTAWDRTTSAVGRLLGATADHPIISGFAADIVLSTIGLAVWSATRALSAGDILDAALPFPEEIEKSSAEVINNINRQIKSTIGVDDSKDNKGTGETDQDDSTDDATYEPSSSDLQAFEKADRIPQGNPDWEAAAVALGLVAVGGLATGSAGTFGGDCTSA